MNKLRKIFTISVMVLTVVVMSGALMAPNANASAQAGDLIKMDGISAVYYLGDDGKRYVFPNEATYMSWYSDFSGVVTIPASELQSYPIGGNVVMRAGVKLVKITTDPTVYAVGPDGMLHSIVSEANAIDLYGADWASMVVDVPDAFFTNYEVGSPLTVGEYPAGQLLKMEGSNDVYYFDGTDYRMFASEAAFLANNFSFDDVVTTDMSFTASGATISGFEAELFDPAQSGTTGGGDISAGTGLSVALSAATPAASTIPSGATAVPFTKFNVTASNDGEIIIDALDVKREGVGASSEISKLYIYEGDTRIGNGRTINSSTQVATFSNLNYTVPAGMTKTLTVVADIAAGDQVGNHKLGVVNASAIDASGATVSGSFPMFGNTMSLSSTDVGGVDIEGSNSYTVKTGKNNVKIGRFTVYVNNTEDGLVKSLRFYNSGRKILSNLELYRGGDMVATGTQDGDYFTFTLDNPILIEKGQSSVFTLQGDIVDARNNDIAYLYIRYSTDVEVEGQTYGYNLLPTLSINSGTSTIIDEISSTNTVQKQTITAEAGQVTLSYNGPVATNVAKNSSDVVLVDFSITAGSDVEVENTSLIIYDNEDGLDDDDISNLELVCDGTIMAEWADFTEASTGTTVSDTSVWSISANDTMNCQVRVDIENTKDENDYVKASIDVDNWTFKDVATGDTITDVVPSSDIAGSEMNVVAASLTVTQAATPPGATHVGGANMIEVNGFNFAAGNAEDITVTALTLHGYIDENNDGNVGDDYTVGVDNSVYFKDVLTSVELYANGTKIGETKTATTGGVVTFNSLNWTVEAGSTERLVVKGTLSSNSPYGGNSDYIQFLVNSVTAEYDAGTSVSPTISSVNTAGDVTVYQTITSAGTLTASLDAGTPDSSLITMATNDVVMTKIKFAATDEDFVVEELQIENAADTDDDAAYGPVTISYTNSAGQTETANAYFTANEANFSGLDILVPADDDTVVTVMADINTDAGGANNDTTTSLSLDGGDDFRAVAQDSGTVDADVSDVTGNSHYIYESVPTVAFAANTPSGDLIPSANGLLARIDITADANEDITFASSASNYITVQVATSGAAISSLVLKDADGNTLDTAATVTSGEATFMIGQSTDSDLTIPAGQTKTVLVYGDITGFTNAGDTVQIWLDDAAADIDWGIDGTGEYQRGNIIFKGDLYGGALVKP